MKVINKDVIERHRDQAIALSCGHPPKQVVVTRDHQIAVYLDSERLLTTLRGHQQPVNRLVEIDRRYLLSCDEDKIIRVWDMYQGEHLSVMNCAHPPQVRVYPDTGLVGVKDGQHIFLWRFQRDKIIRLNGQTQLFNRVHQLHNYKWLTICAHQQRLWSSKGELIHEFSETLFHGEAARTYDGVIELDDYSLITIGVDQQITHWSTQGSLIANYQCCPKLTRELINFIEHRQAVDLFLRQHHHITDFPHRNSPVGLPITTQQPLTGQQCGGDSGRHRQQMWHFFNRPLFEPVTTALHSTLESLRQHRDKLNSRRNVTNRQASQLHRQARDKLGGIYTLFALTLFPLAALAGLALPELPGAIIIHRMLVSHLSESALVAWLVSTVTALLLMAIIMRLGIDKSNDRGTVLDNEALLMTSLLPCYDSLINKITSYRMSVQKQLALRTDPGIYHGELVRRQMAAVIEQSLRAQALDSCGLKRGDLLFNDHQTVILRDWALLQSGDTTMPARSAPACHNRASFWRCANGELLFAVQHIQYLFIHEDRLDIFSCDYDFITDECTNRAAYGFYYQDIVSITKKEVRRALPISDGECPATEIALTARSGESLKLTTINRETISTLISLYQRYQQKHPAPGVEALQQQLQQLMATQHDKPCCCNEQIACLEAQIIDARSSRITSDTQCCNTLAENTLNNLRAKLRLFKQLNYTKPLSLS